MDQTKWHPGYRKRCAVGVFSAGAPEVESDVSVRGLRGEEDRISVGAETPAMDFLALPRIPLDESHPGDADGGRTAVPHPLRQRIRPLRHA